MRDVHQVLLILFFVVFVLFVCQTIFFSVFRLSFFIFGRCAYTFYKVKIVCYSLFLLMPFGFFFLNYFCSFQSAICSPGK